MFCENALNEVLFMIGKSILVVDDEEILVKIGKKILEKQGHEVTMFT